MRIEAVKTVVWASVFGEEDKCASEMIWVQMESLHAGVVRSPMTQTKTDVPSRVVLPQRGGGL